MKKIIITFLLAILFCMGLVAKEITPQKADLRAKVLIVLLDGKPSWFKQQIIDSLQVTYKVELTEAKNPGKIKPENYKAVVVMDKLKAWTWFNGKLKRFAKSMDPKHTVYFVTSGDPDWKWKQKGVKSITSASKNARIPELVKQLRLEIEKG